jgi:hypothetical protein
VPTRVEHELRPCASGGDPWLGTLGERCGHATVAPSGQHAKTHFSTRRFGVDNGVKFCSRVDLGAVYGENDVSRLQSRLFCRRAGHGSRDFRAPRHVPAKFVGLILADIPQLSAKPRLALLLSPSCTNTNDQQCNDGGEQTRTTAH